MAAVITKYFEPDLLNQQIDGSLLITEWMDGDELKPYEPEKMVLVCFDDEENMVLVPDHLSLAVPKLMKMHFICFVFQLCATILK